MPILFRPQLADTVRVRAPPCDAPVQLLFTATHDGSCPRLEIWSNAGPDDRWAAQPFRDPQPRSSKSAVTNALHTLPLDSASDGRELVPDNTLFLLLSVPQNNRDTFEYTFRRIYPSGEVRWLGHASNNGRIVIDKSDPALLLHPAWSSQNTGSTTHSRIFLNSTAADGVEVARFCPDVVRAYVLWGITMNGLRFAPSIHLQLIIDDVAVAGVSIAVIPRHPRCLAASPSSSRLAGVQRLYWLRLSRLHYMLPLARRYPHPRSAHSLSSVLATAPCRSRHTSLERTLACSSATCLISPAHRRIASDLLKAIQNRLQSCSHLRNAYTQSPFLSLLSSQPPHQIFTSKSAL